MKSIIQVRNLNVSLKKQNKEIIHNISFDVPKGKVLGIIGESGSGKTMTCRSMMHLLDQSIFNTSGEIIYQGRNILSLSDKEMQRIRGKEIAMIMQNPMTAFNPVTKLGSQLIETIKKHRKIMTAQAKEEIKSYLKRFHFDDTNRILKSYPSELSGGMLQRIMIALTLMLEPKLIIADESTTALDALTQALVLEKFEEFKNTDITLVVITHDFGVLAKLADEVIVLKDGNIVEKGTIYDIYNNPKQDYTKELLTACALKKEGAIC